MTACILYSFDSNGHISGRGSGNYPGNVPVGGTLNGNALMVPVMIPATVTVTQPDETTSTYETVVDSGWSFSLGTNGSPSLDGNGNYVVVPPQPSPGRPDVFTYSLLAAVKSGVLNPQTEIDPDTINTANRALVAAGLPIIPGTTLVPAPTLTAVCTVGPTQG